MCLSYSLPFGKVVLLGSSTETYLSGLRTGGRTVERSKTGEPVVIRQEVKDIKKVKLLQYIHLNISYIGKNGSFSVSWFKKTHR